LNFVARQPIAHRIERRPLFNADHLLEFFFGNVIGVLEDDVAHDRRMLLYVERHDDTACIRGGREVSVAQARQRRKAEVVEQRAPRLPLAQLPRNRR
jgi:hypothetical protein